MYNFGNNFDKHIAILITSIAVPSLVLGFILGAWIF